MTIIASQNKTGFYILGLYQLRITHWKCSARKGVLRNFKKETLAQVFSCELCEISQKIFFQEHLRATAFVSCKLAKLENLGPCKKSMIEFLIIK